MEGQTEFSIDPLKCQRCAETVGSQDGVSRKDGLKEEGAPSPKHIRRLCQVRLVELTLDL